MRFLHTQVPPPENFADFEKLCLAIFQEVWKDPYAQLVGRSGQNQHGVDIVSSTDPYKGVQCKKRDSGKTTSLSAKELDEMVALAETCRPELTLLIITTTLEKDTKAESYIRQLSQKRKSEGKFEVILQSWADLKFLIDSHRSVLRQFYPEQYTHWLVTRSYLEHSDSAHPLDQLTQLLQVYKEGALDSSLEVEWDPSAYRFLHRVRFVPLETQRLSGPKATCLSVSVEGDWLLALGREDGSVTVRRLRVDKHIDGITGQDLSLRYAPEALLVELSSADHSGFQVASPDKLAAVEFIGGGILGNILRITTSRAQIFDLSINVTRYDQKAPRDIPSLTASMLPALPAGERFIEAQEITVGHLSDWTPDRSIAALTSAGRLFTFPHSRADQPVIVPAVTGKPMRIRRYENLGEGQFLVVSTAQAVAIDAKRSYQQRFSAVQGTTIRDAAILSPFLPEYRRVLLAYDDGSVEIHETETLKGWRAERLRLFDSSIVLLETARTHGVFAAADQNGLVAIWRMGRVSYIKASRHAVTGLAFIDDCTKIITLDDKNVLALWDIVNPGEMRTMNSEDWHLFHPGDCCSGRMDLSYAGGELLISEPHLFGGLGCAVLGASGGGALRLIGKGPLDTYRSRDHIGSEVYGWAERAPVLFAVNEETAAGSDSDSPAYKCYRLWLDLKGAARSASVTLPVEAAVQAAVSDDGKRCVVLDTHLNVVTVMAEDDTLEANLLPPPPGYGSHRMNAFQDAVYFSAGGRHIVLMRGREGRILIYRFGSHEWQEYVQVGPGERDQIRGGYCLSIDRTAICAGLLSGGVIRLDLSDNEPFVDTRYEQPVNRYAVSNDRTILTTVGVSDCGSWIVGSGGRLMYIWHAGDPRPVHQIELEEPLRLMRFAPRSLQFLTVTDKGESHIWDAKAGDAQRHVASGVLAAAFTTTGEYLAVRVEDAFGKRTLMMPVISGRADLFHTLQKAQFQLFH